jgi:hypothetical protein
MDPRFHIKKFNDARGAVQNVIDDALIGHMKTLGFSPTETQNAVSNSGDFASAQNVANQPNPEATLITQYLGWGFDAAKRTGVQNARAALQQHLLANKQTPDFTQKVMQAFENKIANQQAFQAPAAANPRAV